MVIILASSSTLNDRMQLPTFAKKIKLYGLEANDIYASKVYFGSEKFDTLLPNNIMLI